MENLKEQYTREMMAAVGYDVPYDLARSLWWQDARSTHGGLQLNFNGYSILTKIKKSHNINIDAYISPKIIVQLKNVLKNPYFLNHLDSKNKTHILQLSLFGESEALFLIMLDGDINRFIEQMNTEEL